MATWKTVYHKIAATTSGERQPRGTSRRTGQHVVTGFLDSYLEDCIICIGLLLRQQAQEALVPADSGWKLSRVVSSDSMNSREVSSDSIRTPKLSRRTRSSRRVHYTGTVHYLHTAEPPAWPSCVTLGTCDSCCRVPERTTRVHNVRDFATAFV